MEKRRVAPVTFALSLGKQKSQKNRWLLKPKWIREYSNPKQWVLPLEKIAMANQRNSMKGRHMGNGLLVYTLIWGHRQGFKT